MILTGAWVRHAGTQAVFDMIEGGGHSAHFVGGCVRNGVLGRPAGDVDMATTARPETLIALAAGAGFRTVPTGIEHGTVTVVAGGKPHEITTLRRDAATDGRRATVAFSDKLEEDAARRDFTMNALYATRAGAVIDPLGRGLADLRARKVRFIGCPAARIREDFLRILRFFRFHAWYADPAVGPDADGLAACAALADGIERLSRERIGAEMKRLLAAPDPGPALAAMSASGVLPCVLPGAAPDRIPALVALEAGMPPAPMRRLASIGGTDVEGALRLGRAEARALALLRAEMDSAVEPAALGYRHGLDVARDVLVLRAARSGDPVPEDHLSQAARGADATFPVEAADLMGDLRGSALGARLRRLEAAWIASDFTLDRAALLAMR